MIAEKLRKPRHQKLFNDKFMITTDKVSISFKQEVFDKLREIENEQEINYKNAKEILVGLDLYIGTFYINPDAANWKLLNLNVENVYQDVVKLNKQKHNDNDWAYSNDEFQKVYVLANDGERALVFLTYNDSWCPFILDRIDTENIYFEGNIAKAIL